MGLSINQNIAAFNAYRNLSSTQGALGKSLEKLSSGFRINRAADDAAGLAISEGLRSQVGGLKVAVRNSQDGISVVQTAEGALTETHAILQRMRDLSVQAANHGGLSTDAKSNIQAEMTQLQQEVTRIADTTQFNGAKLLDGKYTGTFQVGANQGEVIGVKVSTANGKALDAAGLGIDKLDVTSAAAAGYVAGAKGTFTAGAPVNVAAATAAGVTPEVAIEINGKKVVLREANTDAGVTPAAVDADAVVTKINEAKIGVKAELSGGNLKLTGTDASYTVKTISGTTETAVAGTSAALTDAEKATNDALGSGAEKAINAIDSAIRSVSTVRADLGAVQNRFEHTINNLNVAVENLSASESRIRDTDMASEMVNFTRSQILSQAGTAMLAQANQIPQGVLSLLR